jgi:hypothetical protein
MPRKARLDAPGALHHIVVRDIERRKTFNDDNDRDDFFERLSAIQEESRTSCDAWALMHEHFRLIPRLGRGSLLARKRLVRLAFNSNPMDVPISYNGRPDLPTHDVLALNTKPLSPTLLSPASS